MSSAKGKMALSSSSDSCFGFILTTASQLNALQLPAGGLLILHRGFRLCGRTRAAPGKTGNILAPLEHRMSRTSLLQSALAVNILLTAAAWGQTVPAWAPVTKWSSSTITCPSQQVREDLARRA